MQRIGLLNGNNITYDKDITAGLLALLNQFVVSGFGISGTGASAELLPGKALIECTRSNGEKIMVFFENTENLPVDMSGTKKVYIEVTQAKIDDGSLNAEDGTGIASIKTGASYPASNYMPLYSIVSGVVTNEMPTMTIKSVNVDGKIIQDKSTNIESSSTIDLSSATGNTIHITGTTSITSFGNIQAGAVFNIIFDKSLTLTYNETSLILPTGANIITQSGDSMILISEGSGNWRCIAYLKSDGSAIGSVTPIISSTKKTHVAGENIGIGDALSIGPLIIETPILKSDGNITFYSGFVSSTTVFPQYQTFTIPAQTIGGDISSRNTTITEIRFRTENTTSATAKIEIRDLSDNLLYTSSNVSFSTIGEVAFPVNLIVNPLQQYKVNFVSVSGTPILQYHTVNRYDGGSSSIGSDLLFLFKITETASTDLRGKVFKTIGSDLNYINFIGFATNTVSNGGDVLVDTSGVSDTKTGLTIGSNYYLSNTPGSISTTPGTNIVSIGKAVSTTGIEINIDEVKQLTAITPTVGASPYTYQNNTGRQALVSITGGTVSLVQFSRDNTNFYTKAVATNTDIILGINDYVKITYTVIPTLKIFTI